MLPPQPATATARENELIPTGYTVDSLRCAVWAFLEAENFEDAVVRAVNLGGDADTIGAIAGGLAGIFWGVEAIPRRWLEKLSREQRIRLDRAADGLLKVAQR
ncbi:ADP-ribosylglycohydrolase family protein [Kyrpidia tusciae]|uniref:ADP-ribosylglycohydrolase family protein n=1 Tax=Kyrpidia tusciae TaxID=33943 RepID=UPI00059CCF64|nr:ADP-ribosylglycohydrolase family protein [Kyrpidia tusciae]